MLGVKSVTSSLSPQPLLYNNRHPGGHKTDTGETASTGGGGIEIKEAKCQLLVSL